MLILRCWASGREPGWSPKAAMNPDEHGDRLDGRIRSRGEATIIGRCAGVAVVMAALARLGSVKRRADGRVHAERWRGHRALGLDLALALADDRRPDIVRKTRTGLDAARARGRSVAASTVVDPDSRRAILTRRAEDERRHGNRRRRQPRGGPPVVSERKTKSRRRSPLELLGCERLRRPHRLLQRSPLRRRRTARAQRQRRHNGDPLTGRTAHRRGRAGRPSPRRDGGALLKGLALTGGAGWSSPGC